MKFHKIATKDALGCILAHATEAAPLHLYQMQMSEFIPKGTVLDQGDLEALEREGATEVLVAELEDGDVTEDVAAARLAQALVLGRSGLNVGEATKGRVNLRADHAGLVELDVDAINAVNRVCPSITVATTVPLKRLTAEGLAATIKIIPYAVSEDNIAKACVAAEGAMGLRGAQISSAVLIETSHDGREPAQKGRTSTERRLTQFGVMLAPRIVVPHEENALAKAVAEAATRAELVLILTASATSDIADTAPAAVQKAGGRIDHFGIPVDPGNLLFLGEIGAKPVIGLPGCARSPALNGADWILERIICGLPINSDDISAMGVGGLLKEIPDRGRARG